MPTGDGGGGGQVVSAATGYPCQTAAAGQGFVSIPVENATVLDTLTFTMQTSGTVDAVVGLSAGAPTGFTSNATAFRLNPAGDIDVRDGSTYRADSTAAYGSNVSARLIADLTTHTYSVEIDNGGVFEVAHQYHFRTEQQGVNNLDHLSVIVDSASGSVTVCPTVAASSGVRYSREGSYSVAPLTGGQAVISDGSTTTMMLDAGNHVLASIARGGRVAADGSGNVFIATLNDTTLSLEKLNSGLVSQWVKTRTLPSGHALVALAADGKGGAAIGTRNANVGSVYAFRFASDGTYLGSHGATGETIAVTPTAAVVAHWANSVLTVRELSTSWATVWSNSYAGNAAVQAIAVAPDGSVALGGNLWGPIDFGGGTLAPERLGPEQTPNDDFVVGLSPGGAFVFSQRTETNGIGGIAANGHWIVVSATYWTQFQYPRLDIFTPTGGWASDAPMIDTAFGEHAMNREIALASDNRLWMNETVQWPVVFGFPYLLAM